ncbi:glycosyltransferase family 4 protein, partial [Candidatus Gottesmanbacteria bacterium]|nr:glycosyltransferase family 4 protein [Candidatus Gottesmanbacteria bacterium]
VGTIQPRKNLARLIEAFEMLKQVQHDTLTKDLKLVICGMMKEGRGGWMQEEILKKIQSSKSKIQKDIILTGYVDDNDLPYLMAGAKAFVLPSLYEGFGIPAIEAMACGVPVVVSNVSSLPEIVGDAGILVDPYDINSITRGVSQACYNEALRISLIKRGLQRVNKFNWEKSAALILEVLKTIAN